MKLISALVGIGVALSLSGCFEDPPKNVVPKKPKVAEPPKPVDAGTGDARKLGMMEKYEIWKAQKESDEKLAKELATEEAARLRTFDKSKLPIHLKLLAFEKKTRKSLDDAAADLKGKPDAAAQMEKIAEKNRKPIEAQAAILRKMDPTGGNSNIGTDHDVSLNLLANDYPAALAAALGGDDKPIAEMRKELDKRFAKMDNWLDEVKSSKSAKPEKSEKAAKAGKKARTKGKKKRKKK
jgi:hypothetical protein